MYIPNADRGSASGRATGKHIVFNMMTGCWRGRRLARTEAGLYGALEEQVYTSQKIWKHHNPPLKGTAREMREWPTGIIGRAFFRDSVDNAITKIIRAETAVHGLFYRALAELQKRKPARRLKAA